MAFPPDLPRRLGRLLAGLRPTPRRTDLLGERRWAGGTRHGRRFNRLRRGPRSRAGSALVQALMAGLIAVIGALLLASRLFSSRFNSFSRSDILAAREAAEYGLNELQAQLNSDERGYLWVTQPNRWPVDSSSATSLASALNTCNVQALNSSGAQLTSLTPLPAAGISTPKTIRSVNGTTISYQLRPLQNAQGQRLPDSERPGFIPPALPDQDAATLRQENACGVGTANATAASNFGNLNGGSAIITVTGTVTRGSGASAKSTTFTMSRRVHVLSPAQELKFSFIILGNAYNATCKEGSITLAKCTPDTTPPIMDPPSFGSINDISRLNVLDGNICYGTAAGCSTPLELTTIGCADLDSCIVNNVDTVSGKTRKGFCKQKVKKKKRNPPSATITFSKRPQSPCRPYSGSPSSNGTHSSK